MYSPFFDKTGHPLPIEKVKYEHLSQLVDCDEGHHLEFKLLLEDNGKAQLAKEITSFANCEGGWLIVGIDDKTKDIRPIEKQDYSQRIGKIATRISPIPEFNTRFITMPDNKDSGVLLIFVYEGKNAPYICNGSIYVRSGSSKEPIKPADRGNVEYLYKRTEEYKKEIEDFCKRDYYYSNNNILRHFQIHPMANIYLKNISSKRNNYFNKYSNRDKFIEFVKSSYDMFETISYSLESIIFMHKNIFPGTNSGTLVFEMFYDWSCKITVPIGTVSEGSKELIKDFFVNMGIPKETVNSFKLTNASELFNALFFGMIVFETIAKEYKLKIKDYAFCFELEDSGEIVPFFECKKYKEYIEKYGIPYVHKEINKTKIDFLSKYPKLNFDILSSSFVRDDLAAAFGIRSDCIFEILQDANIKYLKD